MMRWFKMKITQQRLQQIIKEELSDLQSAGQEDTTRGEMARRVLASRAQPDVKFADSRIIDVKHEDDAPGMSRVVAVFKMSDGKNQAFYRSTGKSMGWGAGKWFPLDGWATYAAQVDPLAGGSSEDAKDAWWVKTFKEKTVPSGTPQFETLQAINRAERSNGPLQANETVIVPDPEVDPAGAHKALSRLNVWLRDANAIKTTHVQALAYSGDKGEVVPGRRPFFGIYENLTVDEILLIIERL